MELKNYFAQWAGVALPGAMCYLYLPDTDTLASGLQNAAGADLANPFTADDKGLIQFAAPNGTYDLRVTSGGRDYRVRVQCVDVAESVAAAQSEADRATDEADRASADAERAEAARDAAMVSGDIYTDTASGLAATLNGEYFSVPGTDSRDYMILYMNNGGAAQEIRRYPSLELVKNLAAIGDFDGLEHVTVDALGRIALAIDSEGRVIGKGLRTTAGNAVDDMAETLGKVSSTGDFPIEYAVVDKEGRIALALLKDGRTRVKDVITASGASLEETAGVAQEALVLAASSGSSEFRRAMIEARSRWGQYPKPYMTAPPTLTLTKSADTPAGTMLLGWNETGRWRTSGGFTSQYGLNPYLQWKSKSPNGNSAGFTAAGGVAIETTHTGTVLHVKLRGAGGAIRVLVGDADGRNLAYVSKTAIAPAADGQMYRLTIDFASVSATRTIIIEGDGALQFGGLWVKTGETVTAPAGVKPLVCCMGTSITEASNSWARWIGYLLGADVYNTGVGSSGILNPGTSPRVKQMDRSQDFTTAAFVLGIDENGINDTGDALYTDTSYAGVVRQFGDEYRRVLDAWFTAHPDSPFIGWGPFWPNDGPVANAYRLRDAKQRVISEYPLAAFIDTLAPNNIIKGSVAGGTYPAKDYFAPYVAGVSDTTHPIEPGQEYVGLTVFDSVDTLIRTRF